MKKCLIGFIVVLTSLFSFNVFVNAEEFSVNNMTFNTDELDNILSEEYSSLNLEEYVYKYAFLNDNKMYYVLDNNFQGYKINTTEFINEKSTFYLKNDEYVRELSIGSAGFLFSRVYAYVYDFSNDSYELASPSWNKEYVVGIYDSKNMTKEEIIAWHEERFVYSNTNITTQYNANNEKLNFYLSYKDFINVGIKLTKGYANDLSGRDLYNIEADFSSLSNVNFKYQYKINNGSWIDIDSEDLINDSNNLPIKFSYPAYSNLTFHFRVLDVNDDLLDEKSITITELEDHVYSEIISGSQYSQIEFDFDLPLNQETCTKTEISNTGSLETIEYICPMLDLYYSILNSDVNGLENSMSFGIPYIEKKYLEDTGSSSIEKTEIITLSEYISSFYEGNKVIDFDSNITSLKLIVPLDYLIGSYVNIYFSANTTFDVNLIERSSSSNYYGSVDITGKAGVLFVPKNVNNDFLATFNFNPSSIYGLQLRDTYESNFNILAYYSIGYCDYREYDSTIPIICNEGQGGYTVSFNFERDNVKQSIFVLNKNFPEETKAIVQYDTRYFVPVVYDELWSRPSFEHPITGETVTPDDLIDFDEALNDQDYESFFDMFIDSFNYFKDSLVGIFDNVTYFFNSLPVALKYFFMLIFTIILFIFLIRFIL